MNGLNYMDGIRDGAEIFKNHINTLLTMDSHKVKMIFGDSSITNILNTHSSDEIMSRLGDNRCIIVD